MCDPKIPTLWSFSFQAFRGPSLDFVVVMEAWVFRLSTFDGQGDGVRSAVHPPLL